MSLHSEVRREAQRASALANKVRIVELTCSLCRQPFHTTADRRNVKVCSAECAAQRRTDYRRSCQRNTEQRQAARRRERERAGKPYRTAEQIRNSKLCLIETTFQRAIERKEARPADAAHYAKHRAIEKARRRYAENPSRERARVKRYKAANPKRVAAWHSKRLSAWLAAWDGSPVDMERVIEQTTDCIYCGRLLERRTVTIDHIIPVSRGGRHADSNLVGCCLSCNCRKRDKPFAEWLNELSPERRVIALALYVERYDVPPQLVGGGWLSFP